MRCERAQELFSDYCEGNVQRALLVPLENHLGECADCRAEVEGLRDVWRMLDGAPVVEPPPTLRAVVWQRIDEAATAKKSARTLPKFSLAGLLRPRALAWSAAALLVLVLAPFAVRGNHAPASVFGWFSQHSNQPNITAAALKTPDGLLEVTLHFNTPLNAPAAIDLIGEKYQIAGAPEASAAGSGDRVIRVRQLSASGAPLKLRVSWREGASVRDEIVPVQLP